MASDITHLTWPRVAVIGCGYWGKNLVRNFAELGVLGAVADHSAELAVELAGRHNARALDVAQILNDPTLSAVVIATPGATHFELAKAALNAGKHVYVEKPLTLSVAHSLELTALARTNGRTLMVGHILRYHPAFTALLGTVQAGGIGTVRHVVSNRLNLGKILDDEDVLWSLAPHDLSMVAALLGGEPERVVCMGDAFLRPNVVDVALVRLSYSGARSAEIRLSWISPFKEHKLIVTGETGSLIFDDTKGWGEKLTLRRPVLDWGNPAVTPGQGTTELLPLLPGEPLKEECLHFLNSIKNGTTPLTDGHEGVAITRLLERASTSLALSGVAT